MSMHQDLDDAICILALISDHSTGLEESIQEIEARDTDEESQTHPHDEEVDDPEDPTVLGAIPENEQYRIELKNQLVVILQNDVDYGTSTSPFFKLLCLMKKQSI
ncbi:hypothetical protein PITC_012200 [Penicillium italicum]|uniref:Uncharacterized protein n=1 Tax=Penicillium italicum TaxID=40296 RepID=A0A0A2KF99_PENIT|nr:hypothetical protein PITC_012200 [Penicillium italicum]